MTAIVSLITSVEPYGENLSVVTISHVRTMAEQGAASNQVIANKREDGSFRWRKGEIAVYVSEGSILPEDVLKARGYWDEEKDRGLLDGGPRNRVKMKRLAGFESRGLLFKVAGGEPDMGGGLFVERGDQRQDVKLADDVSEFFGITEFGG